MNPLYLLVAPEVVCYDNDNSALIPDLWAREGLVLLTETTVATRLVNRQFENDISKFGDVVNTRRPNRRQGRRRSGASSDTYVVSDADLTNVQVKLDQWFYDSFVIDDMEASQSMQSLVQTHLLPAMQNLGRQADRAILGRIHEFVAQGPSKRAGALNSLSSSNARDYLLDAREIMNNNLCPLENRMLFLAPSAETPFLKTDLFIAANQRGDGGTALDQALLGQILGFKTYMGQNVNHLPSGYSDVATGTVTNALAANGSGSQACSVTGYTANVGEYAVVSGNDQPTYLTAATTGAGNTTAVTLNEANKYATAAAATITIYKACTVSGAYAAGYAKEVLVNGWTNAPAAGQVVSFGTGANRRNYTVNESTLSSAGVQALLLDRPLEVALANADLAFPGPAGSLNWAVTPNAVALVSRPLAIPPSDLGVKAAVANFDGISIRVVMQYDSSIGGTRVNIDMLAGVAVLDSLQCVPLLG